jgi:hypothetical protein
LTIEGENSDLYNQSFPIDTTFSTRSGRNDDSDTETTTTTATMSEAAAAK